MSVTIYQLEHSPYCFPITRALEALGVPYKTKNVSNSDRREIAELTSGLYYQVPVLVDGKHIVFESSASSCDVACYVDATFGNDRLFPKEFEGWQTITLSYIENEVEGVTFRLVDPDYLKDIADPIERALIRRHKERKFGFGCIEKWKSERALLTAQTEKLLKPFEDSLQCRPFLFGDQPVFCDFALYGILGNLTYRGYNKAPKSLQALTAWFKKISSFHF